MPLKEIVACIACCVLFTKVNGQSGNQLTIPSTPGFSILNTEPASVMRPTNNKDFGADLLNSVGVDGKLLTNIGLEVTPYWLKTRPALSEADYLRPGFKQGVIQSLNFSAASVKDSVSGNNKLGIGLRFKLLHGRPTDEFYQKKEDLKIEETVVSLINSAKAQIGTSINTKRQLIDFIVANLKNLQFNVDAVYMNRFKSDAVSRSEEFSDTPAGINDFIEVLKNDKVDANGELIKKVVQLSKKRKGVTLELAGASSFFTAGNSQHLEKIGIWANASSYVTTADAWAFSVRYFLSRSDSAFSNFDAGLSYTKELDNFNISLESMLRWRETNISALNGGVDNSDEKFSYRLAAQASQRVNNYISVNFSLGKNFDSPFISGSGFFSLFGINYSIFSKQEIKLE